MAFSLLAWDFLGWCVFSFARMFVFSGKITTFVVCSGLCGGEEVCECDENVM